MVTAEIVNSGRFSGGRSNFNQMCTLLSQYLKENGSFGDLKLGLTHSSEPQDDYSDSLSNLWNQAGSPTETMNLLPMIEKSGLRSGLGSANLDMPPASFHQKAAVAGGDETQKESNSSAQMTIFYAGQVIVFDDFPADKAKEIMMLASKSSTPQNRPNAAFPPLHAAQSPAESTTGFTTFSVQEQRPHLATQPPLCSDLPIARKNSLARFLEKRKDRITANAPYPASKPGAPPKPETPPKPEAWLGLASELPLQIQRH